MSLIKEEAIKLIQSLPDDCTIEDILYRLEVRRRVERGLKAIDEGRVVSQADAERRAAGWAGSSATLEDLRKEIAIGIDQADRGDVAPLDARATLDRVRARRAIDSGE